MKEKENSLQKYPYNPFKRQVIEQTVRGTRTIFASPTKENRFAMVNRETGEDNGDIAFGKKITVDKTHFLKLYADGVKMFLDIKPSGVKVFMLIFDLLMEDKNFQADRIDLIYELLDEETQKRISRSVFYAGIRELKKAKFLAPAIVKGSYWINTSYLFRGDRLTLVNQYILEKEDKKGLIEHE